MKFAQKQFKSSQRRPMKKTLILVFSLLPLPVFAGQVTDVGKITENALERQRSGVDAAPTRPMLKDVADRTYERYLESFTHPIPEQFEREQGFLNGN